MSVKLGLTTTGYLSLEADESDLETALSLRQAKSLARLLDTDLLSLLGESRPPSAIPISGLRQAMKAQFATHASSREMLEDVIDWDIAPFLDGQVDWDTVYTVAFVKSLAAATGQDWREVLAGIDLG